MSIHNLSIKNGHTTVNNNPVSSHTKIRLDEKNEVEDYESVLDAIRTTQYGEITIIIQDGYIIQINRLEKKRFR